MAFAFNLAGKQQLSMFDSYNSLTEREKSSWINHGQNTLLNIFFQRLMRLRMLFFTALRIRVPILL